MAACKYEPVILNSVDPLSGSTVFETRQTAERPGIEGLNEVYSTTSFTRSRRSSPRWQRFHRKWIDWWLPEIISVALSVSLLVGLIVLLLAWDGQELLSWNAHLSINTVVAILSMISKAFLLQPMASCLGQFRWLHFLHRKRPLLDFQMIDEASRGPLGATMAILRLRSLPVAVAAMVMLSALAFEAFAQQAVGLQVTPFTPVLTSLLSTGDAPSSSLQTQLKDAANSALLGSLSAPNHGGDQVTQIALQQFLDESGASMTGIYPASAIAVLPCSNDICASDPYASLGFCSDCQNSTAQLTSNCSGNGSSCTWSLPNDVKLEDNLHNTVYSSMPIVDPYRMGTVDPLQASLLANFSAISKTNATTSIGDSTAGGHTARTCSIFLCAKISQLVNFGGVLYELLLEPNVAPPQSPTSGDTSLVYFPLPNTTSSRTISNKSVNLQNRGSSLIVGWSSILFFQSFLTSMFNGSLSNDFQDLPTQAYFQSVSGYDIWFGLTTLGFYTTDTNPGSRSQDTNPTGPDPFAQWLDQMCQGMESWMQTYFGGNAPDGNVFSDLRTGLTVISVRWPWLIFPITLQFFCVIFLAWTMVQTKRRCLPVWKSSTVATLFHGIDQDAYTDIVAMDKISVVETLAGKRVVTLTKTSKGYRLIEP